MRSAMKSTYTDVLRRATRTGSGTLRIVSLLLLIPFYGKGDIAATTQSLAVSISPAGKISVPASATLTDRQREVLQLVAEGRGTKEIATILDVSVKTVEFHKYRIMLLLNLHTTADLTKYAISHGITSL